jgi:hypothetical protein
MVSPRRAAHTLVIVVSPPPSPCRRLHGHPPPSPPSACYGVLRFVMESGAKGCEVIVSGKLRAARAKSMKFKDGFMVSSGDPTRIYLDTSVRHVLLRQGVLGIKVRERRRRRRPRGLACWQRRRGLASWARRAAALRHRGGGRVQPLGTGHRCGHGLLLAHPCVKPRGVPSPSPRRRMPLAPSPPPPQVRIMKEWDPSGRQGPKIPLPDVVKVHEPKVR